MDSLFTFTWPDWVDPKQPVTGPPMLWSYIEGITVHYTAAVNLIDGDPGEDWQKMPAYIRQMHNSYLNRTPPYSIGYNAGFDQRGGSWKLRGYSIQNAANGAADSRWMPPGQFVQQPNMSWVSFLCMVDGDDRATPAMAAEIRKHVAWLRAHTGKELPIRGHFQHKPTSCPGAGLKLDIIEGRFEPTASPPPPPVIVLPPGGSVDDFIEYVQSDPSITSTPAVFARWRGGYKTWMSDPAVLSAHEQLVRSAGKSTVKRVVKDAAMFRALGFVFGPVHPTHDPWGV